VEPFEEEEKEALCLWPAPKYWRPVILWPLAFLPRFDLMLTVVSGRRPTPRSSQPHSYCCYYCYYYSYYYYYLTVTTDSSILGVFLGSITTE